MMGNWWKIFKCSPWEEEWPWGSGMGVGRAGFFAGSVKPYLRGTVKMKHCYYNESVGFFYNNSRKELTSYWRTKDVLVVALGLTVSVIVLLTNLLVISAIIINRRFHYPIYYLLGNLAAADLFAGIAYMFLMFHTGPRTAGLSVRTWFIRQSLLDTSLTASVVNLLAIAVERHQTVFTMQLHSSMSNQRVVILIICIWVTALLLGLIPSYGWHCLCDLGNCSRMAPLYSRSYLTFWALSNLVIFLIMVVVYTHIFVYVKRKMTRMSKHTSFHPRYKETMINLIKTVIIILSAFVICWTPGQVLLLLDGLACESCNVLAVEKYVLLLAEINSLINAIVYSYRDNEMRSTFRKILCFICYRNPKYSPASVKSNVTKRRILSQNGHSTMDSSL
ncbi:lysophosphatidic acid receptor 2 isoform X1 [Mauremys mutica]|uniref:lysophosphatidic acid receptor 2 isoform X1 n=2 Tax=Mauremys mutica TaxID=74926 RepID=UPI001D15FCD1|nr:lysophosphatidic acid receptor 2 isoform X1 [Mauremys mutica]XP_044851637.1 lysophosphatidic acid receptor 2 isoform X1 [Mauremys mutica]XP_044851638.1 lysophosphatidic acid receptor 2 isoform X1 [Mauremys mutica]